MPDSNPERDAILRALPLDDLARTLAASQTITPLAYARTVASQPLAAAPPSPSPDTAHDDASVALPMITFGEAGAAPGPRGRHDLEVVRVLGSGGMGVVSLARQHSLHREVAVKTVRGAEVHAPHAAALLHEAVVTGTLEHPNIVPVHALGRDAAGRPVMVMKRIEGTCWRDLLADASHPAWEQLPGVRDDRLGFHLEVLEQVCNALHFAHRRGYVHRDVKPENVMIGGFGEVYLLDWGIATSARRAEEPAPDGDRHPVGTPAYMAPEMISQRECTERTDVYLLGATLHEVLTGRPRHDGETIYQVLVQALESPPHAYDPSAVPAELGALCNRATAADPAERPESALAFRQALREFRRHRSSIAAARAALERLDALRPLAGAAGASDEAARMQVHRLFAECRFGLTHALREWPENAAARAGLEDGLALMSAYELERGNADAAGAHLAEMTAPPPELAARLDALRRRLRDERAEAERLKGLARELDPEVGSRARSLVMAGIGVLGAVMTWLVLGAGSRRLNVHDPAVALQLVLVYDAAFAVLAVTLRRRLTANRSARALMALLGATLVAVTLHRVGALSSREPVASVLSTDMLLLALGLVGAGVWAQRLFLGFAAGAAVNAMLIVWLPQHALALFGGGSIMTLLMAWVSWRRPAPRAGG